MSQQDRDATRVVIMGAAGRDFHNFNCCYRHNPRYKVVAFTAAQIPNIANRRYPAELAGRLYPEGIPIRAETELPELISRESVGEVVFAYSDVSFGYVMERANRVIAAGARFTLLGRQETTLSSRLPVVAVCAVRTGCGKSATARKVCRLLRERGKRVVVVRHPMPYCDLLSMRVQRFASLADLEEKGCSIEEREEYESHVRQGTIVYAGVDYEAVLEEVEREADVIVWDGGNNDLPFYHASIHITLVDPHRAGDEMSYHPGLANLLLADVVVVPKQDTADRAQIETVKDNVRAVNPNAVLIDAASPVAVDRPELIFRKRVLVVEDGPSVTHGGMGAGAGFFAAQKFRAAEIVDPAPYAVGSIREVLRQYPHLRRVLPSMGYGETQMEELRKTIESCPCDTVVLGTPVDLGRLLDIPKPVVRAEYEIQEIGMPTLETVLEKVR